MQAFLNGIRTPRTGAPLRRQLLTTAGLLAAGFALGVLQKWLDSAPGSQFQSWIQLDISNFFGRFAIWILLGTAISVYARTPLRAAINTFAFLIGMLAGYYLYCRLALGFLPKTYLLIWVAAACASFFLAYACWYARGEGPAAVLLSGAILGVLLAQAVSLTQGLYLYHAAEAVVWVLGFLLLYRRKPKELALELAAALAVAVAYQLAVPYWG